MSKLLSPSFDSYVPRKGATIIKKIRLIAKHTTCINVHFNQSISSSLTLNLLKETSETCETIDRDLRLQNILMAVIEFDRIADYLALEETKKFYELLIFKT